MAQMEASANRWHSMSGHAWWPRAAVTVIAGMAAALYAWNIAGSVKLYRVRYESPVLAGQLSQAERRKLLGHDLRSYDAALKAVKAYEVEVVP